MYQGWFRLHHSDELYLKQTPAGHVGDRTGTVNSPLGSIDIQIYARSSIKQPPKQLLSRHMVFNLSVKIHAFEHVKLRKRASCPQWLASMASSGEPSPAVVQTYRGLPSAVRRTRRWTLHYSAEMFIRLLMCTANVCKCLATKRDWGWPILKKLSVQIGTGVTNMT